MLRLPSLHRVGQNIPDSFELPTAVGPIFPHLLLSIVIPSIPSSGMTSFSYIKDAPPTINQKEAEIKVEVPVPPPAEVDEFLDSLPTASEPSVLPLEVQGAPRRPTSTSRRRPRSTIGRPHIMSHTNAQILPYVGTAESMVGKRSRSVLDSEVNASVVVESADNIEKASRTGGPAGCCYIGG